MKKIDHIFPAKHEAKDSDLVQKTNPTKEHSWTLSNNLDRDDLEHLKGDYNRWLPIVRKLLDL